MVTELQQKMGGWIVELVAPALIMVMTGSLTYFLMEVCYYGDYPGRVGWVLGLFIFASVLISRISIMEGFEKATLYGLILGLATLFVLTTLSNLPLPLGMGFIGVIWWFNSKLTWDCTVLDHSRDSTDRGLLARFRPAASSARRNHPEPDPEPDMDVDAHGTTSEQDHQPAAWTARWLGRKKVPNTPGVWVLILSLAAFPIFGIGQGFIGDEIRRQNAFFYFCTYLAAGLGLLATTALLGLQRYLQKRNATMPNGIALGWIGFSALMILAILIGAWILPRPHAEYSIAENPFRFEKSSGWGSSRNSFGSEGKKTERPGQGSGTSSQQPTGGGSGKSSPQSNDRSDARQQDSPKPSAKSSDAGSPPSAKNGDSAKGQSPGNRQNARGATGQNGARSPGTGRERSSQDSQSTKRETGQNSPQGSRSNEKTPSQNSDNTSDNSSGAASSRSDAAGSDSKPSKSSESSKPSGQGEGSARGDQAQSAGDAERNSGESSSGSRAAGNEQQSEDTSSQNSQSGSSSAPRSSSGTETKADSRSSGQSSDSSKSSERGQSSGIRSSSSSTSSKENASANNSGSSTAKADDSTGSKSSSGGVSQRPSSSPPSFSLPSFSGILWIVQTIFWVVLLIVAVVLIWKYRERIWQSFKQFLEDWKNFWRNLWSRGANTDRELEPERRQATARPVPRFAQFSDPFRTGKYRGWSQAELVNYSFEAVQAWGRERGIHRDADQTPHEFALQFVSLDRQVARQTKRLADFYCQIAFAKQPLDEAPVQEELRKLWQTLESARTGVAAGVAGEQEEGARAGA